MSFSTAKVIKWLPYLSSYLSREPATPESLSTPSSLRDAHEAASAWFLGPKAENAGYLKMYVEIILNDLVQCRRDFARDDEHFIDARIASSPAFRKSMSILRTNLTFLSRLLPQHSVPFYSPRYMAHMVNDVTMPATLGYLMGLMYNSNNISPEAGPLTHIIEYDVGQQLCGMLGYNAQSGAEPSSLDGPTAWGHITCGGSIANMESMLVARNLKFYPLALKRATENEPCLAHVATHFKIRLCTGEDRVLADCDAWDLLNLTPDEVVSLSTRIAETFGLSSPALQAILNKYLIQTSGKADLEKYFGVQCSPQYLCPHTAHYSWPKGAAITGIGSRNIIGVPVDEQARMDFHALDMLLAESLQHRQAIYAVVVIMGTTEHGSVDPLSKVLAIRWKYQTLGLSFLVHADAAWGGYFTSMLVPDPAGPGSESRLDDPTLFLNAHTENELRHLRFADSVTVDPHKSGYTPFPAGALCYRDGRLRFLVAWESPVTGSVEADTMEMGLYGLEGSKPGAAPLAVWLGHEVIGLHKGGFGFLLGQSMFSSTRMYGHWATMSLDHPDLLVVPFRMLPSEMDPDASANAVDEERRFIRDTLLKPTRDVLAKDPKACALMRRMGPDLVVNAFACNFRIDGVVNQDVFEANALNSRIYDRLSLKKLSEELGSKKAFIMISKLSQKGYGVCLTKFKERLGLRGQDDLAILASVSMSPFTSPSNFELVLADAFREVAEEEVEVSVARNKPLSALRAFVLQGCGPISLVHMACFGTASLRRQCILEGELSDAGLKVYLEAKREDPASTYLACTLEREELSTIIRREIFKCVISKLTSDGVSAVAEAEVTNIRVIKDQPLSSGHLDTASYPSRMPFYLYGTRQGMHIDHILVQAPNAQLSAGEVTYEVIEGSESAVAEGLKNGLIAVADALPEHLMQPFTPDRLGSFFHPGANLDVTIHYPTSEAARSQGHDLCDNLREPLARARLTLGNSTFVDEHMINLDPVAAWPASESPFETSKSMPGHFPEAEATLTTEPQDHPLFRGYIPGGTTNRDSLPAGSTQSWRAVWDRALAGRQFADIDPNEASDDSATSDHESKADEPCMELFYSFK